MTGTIESINTNILLKIQYLNELIKYVNIKKETERELATLSEEYDLGSVKILSDYFLLVNKANQLEQSIIDRHNFNQQKNKYYTDYQIFLKKENFLGRIDRIYYMIKNAIQSNFEDIQYVQDKVKTLLMKYNNLSVQQTVNLNTYTKCTDCNKDMKIISSSSEMVCINCGKTEILIGTVFEDEQFYYQEGRRTKHGSYDPSKHCKFWLERIQALESKSIPDEVINDVKKCIKYNNIKNMEEITCEDIRGFLRHTKNTAYNEHVPLIRKMITGISPPQLTDTEVQIIILMFSKVIKIYEDIKPSYKTNVMYHPYPISKIIEHILRDVTMKKRRNSILSCIHLQSRETLIENDKIWKQVCDIMDIEYIPTDRNEDYN